MKIVVVEDEILVAKRLLRFISQCLEQNKYAIKHFFTLDDAEEYLSNQIIDLLFLDLNLHGKNGFELLNNHSRRSFHTIVVSANTEYALQAFEYGVLDFIAKPFTIDRVDKGLKRFKNQGLSGECKYLAYKKNQQTEFIEINKVIFIKAAGHYSEIFTEDSMSILHDKNLDRLTQILSNQFYRIHRSYTVNIEFIENLTTEPGGKYQLLMKTGEKLPIGRTKYKQLLEFLATDQ